MSERVTGIRRRLEDVALPLDPERRITKEGVGAYLHTLLRALDSRHRDITRVVNTNTVVPQIPVGGDFGPAYAGAWIPAAGFAPLRFWRTPWNDVHLVGLLDRSPRTPASPETITTIPLGFRPPEALRMSAVEWIATPVVHQIDLATTGVLQWNGATTFAAVLSISAVWRAVA